MKDFFSPDGTFNTIGNMIADIMILGVLWFFCSLPVITIGASTTALFYVMTRRISNHEGYILKDFFRSFKTNFKIATLSWLTIVAAGLILYFNIQASPLIFGERAVYIVPVQWTLCISLCFTAIYIFPVLSRFTMGYRQLFKTSFFLAYRHIFSTIVCMAVLVSIVWVAVSAVLPLLLIGAGIYAYAASYLLMRIFRKYRPEIDRDPGHDGAVQ